METDEASPMPVHVQEEQVAFYFELGIAISQWAHLERSLCEVATFCFARAPATFTLESYADHYDAFFSIENFRSKISYTDSVFQRRFGESVHAADWKQIKTSLGKRAAIRNRLAHNPMLGIYGAPEGRRYCIVSRQIDVGMAPKQPAGALFLEDIVRHRLRFFALNVRLRRFYDRLRGRDSLFDAESEQPRDPPPLRQIVDQIFDLPYRRASPAQAEDTE
ncbi:MAG: hypothetical protein KIS73_05180 [Enhydrobacter sp.]|nr:hypothetical protein [Enhydrobacter sp.]